LVLRRCLNSLIALNYPTDKLEILCGSDGSSDATNNIIREFEEKNSYVRPYYYDTQRGKIAVLNDLAEAARNEILLFVDADIVLNADAVLAHVRHYCDSAVGGVAGELRFDQVSQNGVYKSESSYWDLETSVRRNEGLFDSTLGLYGGNYSMRRALWRPIPDRRMYDDFFSVLSLLSQGVRVVYESNAIATERYGRTHADEYARKKRNAYYSLRTLRLFWQLLLKPRTAWMLWPHKVLRWESGILLLGIVLSTIVGFLSGDAWARPFLFLEICGAFMVLLGFMGEQINMPIPIASHVFWLMNIQRAGLVGTFAFLFKGSDPSWTQTTRVGDSSAILNHIINIKEATQ